MLVGMADHLELPRPWRLMLTAGWNLAESLGIPVAGYLVGAKLGGRDVGMMVATALVWLTAVGRKAVTRSVPGLLMISALVLTLQTAVVLVTGSMLFFLLQFPLANLGLCVLFARTAPTRKPLVAQLAAEVVALRVTTLRPITVSQTTAVAAIMPASRPPSLAPMRYPATGRPRDSARFHPAVSISRQGRGNSRCSAMATSIPWLAAAPLELRRGHGKKSLRVPHGLYNGEPITEVH
jgi:hypothetical protein